MSIAVDRGLRLVVEYALAGNRFSSSFIFTVPGGMVITDPADLVTAFRGSTSETALLDMLSVEATLASVYAYAIVPGSAVAFRTPALVTEVGTITGDPAPSNLAAVGSLLQGETSSKANGRCYISGFGDSAWDSTSANFSFAFQALLQDFLDKMLLGHAGFSLGVLSKFVGSAPRVPPVIFPVTSVVARLPVRQQRRRVTELRATS